MNSWRNNLLSASVTDFDHAQPIWWPFVIGLDPSGSNEEHRQIFVFDLRAELLRLPCESPMRSGKRDNDQSHRNFSLGEFKIFIIRVENTTLIKNTYGVVYITYFKRNFRDLSIVKIWYNVWFIRPFKNGCTEPKITLKMVRAKHNTDKLKRWPIR